MNEIPTLYQQVNVIEVPEMQTRYVVLRENQLSPTDRKANALVSSGLCLGAIGGITLFVGIIGIAYGNEDYSFVGSILTIVSAPATLIGTLGTVVGCAIKGVCSPDTPRAQEG